MKIAIGASSLCYAKGGTERVAIEMAHAMLERRHEVHLFAYDYQREPAYPLNNQVQLHLLPNSFSAGQHAVISKVRQFLRGEGIDVFVSLQSEWTHMLWALCCLSTGVPFICSERSDPRFSESVTWNRPGRISVLACADAIHELVPTHADAIPAMHRSKTRFLPNAAPKTEKRADVLKRDGTILFLARFIPGKRADLLLRAFAILAPCYKKWKLRIAGYGPEEKNLRKLAAKLQIREQVEFVIHPASWAEQCASAQIYCLPTKVEGFPNSVLEAMACGLPIAGIADCPAMAGIVRKEGMLAPEATPESLAGILQTLMDSPKLRQKMGEASLASCATTYEQQRLWQEWEQFLLEIAERKGSTIMDSFSREPWASQFTLASAVRREYLYRNFGDPIPCSWRWWQKKAGNFIRNFSRLAEK